MPRITVTVEAFECSNCGHVWLPHANTPPNGPKVCSKCSSHYWDRPSICKKNSKPKDAQSC
jgi:formylmethanofuran dehydrogenase subunit E